MEITESSKTAEELGAITEPSDDCGIKSSDANETHWLCIPIIPTHSLKSTYIWASETVKSQVQVYNLYNF